MNIGIVDLYGYINEINGGYINARYHPENDNIVILNYTEMATFERRWNKYTMSARGLILDLTDVKNNGKIKVLAQPFEKFFNYGENLDYEKDIDFTKIESVMEKMDGSLGISYIIDGKIRFATRGSFESEQAIKATEIWHRKYKDADEKYHKMFTGKNKPTLLVEIIYPSNRVVVDYKGREQLVLLGVIDKGVDYHYKGVKDIGDMLQIPVAKQYDYSLEDMIKMKKEISANEEGWIIRFNDDKRLKIKGDQYLNVHRAMYGLSDKAKVETWADGNIDELIMTVPEEFRDEIEELRDKLDERTDIMYRTILELYYGAINLHSERKDFAIFVNKAINKEFRKFMFIAYNNNGMLPKAHIREYIYKNYKHYLEVIGWKNNDS